VLASAKAASFVLAPIAIGVLLLSIKTKRKCPAAQSEYDVIKKYNSN